MKFTVKERLLLTQMLPMQGNIAMVRVIHELRMQIGLSQEEIKKYDLKIQDGQAMFKDTKDEKEIDLGVVGKKIITDALFDMNEKKMLTEEHLSLWEKFEMEEKKK